MFGLLVVFGFVLYVGLLVVFGFVLYVWSISCVWICIVCVVY